MEKTENYQLNQWEAGDAVHRMDFNADNAKIDAAIAAVKSEAAENVQSLGETVTALAAGLGTGGHNCRIAWGTYIGTGTYGPSNPNGLNVDFYPVLVFVGSVPNNSFTGWPSIFIRDCPVSHADMMYDELTVTWTDTGLSWYDAINSHGQLQNNEANKTYYYCVIGCDKSAE